MSACNAGDRQVRLRYVRKQVKSGFAPFDSHKAMQVQPDLWVGSG
jgi:hypothetical protein